MPAAAPAPLNLDWMREHPQAFSNAASEALLHYVYMLTIPQTGRPFYIGKGQGNRVFQHVQDAAKRLADGTPIPTQEALQAEEQLRTASDEDADTDPQSLKIKTLMSILADKQMPGMFIVREGMTEEEALRTEGACIDLMQYLFDRGLVEGLTNLQGGHATATFRSTADVEAAHGASFDLNALPERDPNAPVLFLNINTRWREVVDPNPATRRTLYEVSQGWWKLNPANARQCQYVVVHALGVVRGVFKITGWSERDPDNLIRFYADTTPPDGLSGADLRNKNIAGVVTPGRQAVRYITAD